MCIAPHPPFGHLLPASGEKDLDERPSPRLRGEGGRRPGEGLRSLLLILSLLAAAPLFGEEPARLAAGTLVLEGSSNVTDWRCASTTLDMDDLELHIPVKTIRCGNRQMERDLYRALRASEHPTIEFRFLEMTRGAESAKIRGDLSLAGTTRTIEVGVDAQRLTPDRFLMHVRFPLRMTAFGITPPTAFFGIVKAKDDLVVHFDLVLQAHP